MSVHHILHINIRVPPTALEICRDFYCDVLGLKVGPRPPFASVGYWLYVNDSPLVHLVADPTRADASTRGHPALDHVALHCTDLQAMLAVLKSRNIEYRLSTVPTLHILQINFTDPVGVGIELSFEGEAERLPRNP